MNNYKRRIKKTEKLTKKDYDFLVDKIEEINSSIDYSKIQEFTSIAEATAALGFNKMFLWSENNIDGVVSPIGSNLGVTKIAYNFDITADWANISGYPVTDQASFITLISSKGNNNISNIVITDFIINGNRLRCNMTADGTYLDLRDTNITEVKSIGKLEQLQRLYLDNNQIVEFNPTIALPNSLQNLYLANNQIVTFNPTIALPNSLQNLYLNDNLIVTFNPTIALPNSLQILRLNNNQIVTFNPTIALPNSLRYLYLVNNQIVEFNPTIALPNSLQNLTLDNNQIVTFNPTIALPNSLQNLYLNDNQIVEFNPTIALSNSLRILRLNNNQIVEFNPTIALPNSLRYLYLNDNQMTTQGYTNSEPWANSLPITTGNTIYLYSNVNNANFTNFQSILESKGWVVAV